MYRLLIFTLTLLTSSPMIAQNWLETQKILPSSRNMGDSYGASVSVYNDYAVVGARGVDAYDSEDNLLSNCGAAYIYKKSINGEWEQVQQLLASDRLEQDLFGANVIIYGNRIAIGASGVDYDEAGENFISSAGAIYIFDLDTNGIWIESQKIVSSNRKINGYFGGNDKSIALNDYYLVGGGSNNDLDENNQNELLSAGAAFVFELDSNGDWIEVQKIVSSDRQGSDQFGYKVVVSDNILVISSINQDYDEQGLNEIANSGAVYLFERNESTEMWNETHKLVANSRTTQAHFGYALSSTDSIILIGAYGEPYDSFGQNYMVNSGAAYIFERNDADDFIETIKIVPSGRMEGDLFGFSLSISSEAALISSRSDLDAGGQNFMEFAGAAYIYSEVNDEWIFSEKIVASDRNVDDHFGTSVAIHQSSLVVGSPNNKYDENGQDSLQWAGATYVFELCHTYSSLDISTCNLYESPSGNIYTESGMYFDTIPNSNLCDSIIAINLTIDTVDVSVSQDGVTLTANQEGADYQWLSCNGFFEISGAIEQSFSPIFNGYYAVIVDYNSCIDTSSCFGVIGVGIEDLSLNELLVYPNPFSNEITIDIPGYTYSKGYSYEVLDSVGKTVVQQTEIRSDKVSIKVENLPSGVYVVNIIVADARIVYRVVKL